MNFRVLRAVGLCLAFLTCVGLAAATRPGAAAVAGTPGPGEFLPDTFVICRVGDRVTRVSDYVSLYFNSYILDRPGADSAGRVTFLQNIISKDVLGQVALRINRPFRFEDRAVMREFEQRTLSNALYRTAVLESLHVTEDEILREYALYSHEIRVRRIIFPDLATAQRVRLEMIRGKLSWQQAYDRYSLLKEKDQARDGELGWTVRGGASLEMARKFFSLGAGGISEPLEQPEGWFVIQVVERRPGSPPGVDAVREFLRSQLAEERATRLVQAVRGVIRKQIGMVYDTAAVKWAAAQFQPVQTTTRDDKGVPHIEFNTILPEFSPQDTSKVLARHRDGVWTLGRFFDLYHEIQALTRPNVNTPEDFFNQLDAFAFEPYMAKVAMERGLDRDSAVVAQIAKKREEILVEHLYSDSILSRVAIDPAARRKYYEDNKPGFITYSRVRFASLWSDSKAGADSLAARLRSGERAEDILQAESLLGIDRGSIQERGEEERGTYQKVIFEELRPGQVTVIGPDRVGHYLVLQKLEVIPGRLLSYDEASGIIDETLHNLEAERLLREFVARHSRKFPIVSRPDLVMKIRLVDPTI